MSLTRACTPAAGTAAAMAKKTDSPAAAKVPVAIAARNGAPLRSR